MPQVVDAGAVAPAAVGKRAGHMNRRKFLSMLATVSGRPDVPGKNQSPPVRPATRA